MSWLRQWPLAAVVVGVVVGLVLVSLGSWRPGSVTIGTALALGALLRLVLPRRGAGLLQVRSKAFDVIVLLALGLGIVVLALVAPGRVGR